MKPLLLIPVIFGIGASFSVQARQVHPETALDKALVQAVYAGDDSKAMDLLAGGASANAQEDEDGALWLAAERVVNEGDSITLVQRLLEKGADINAQNKGFHETAMMRALDYPYSTRQAQLFRLLLAWHPRLELKNDMGDTALRQAEKEGNFKIAKMLRQADAKEYSAFPALVKRAVAYYVTDLGRGQAESINSRDDVVGITSDGSKDDEGQLLGHAFLWRAGNIIHLGSLGGPSSIAFSLNDRDRIVGEADTSLRDGKNGPYVRHAFLWQPGRMHDLRSLDRINPSRAVSINNKDVIAEAVNVTLYVQHGRHIRAYDYAHPAKNGFGWDTAVPVAMNNKAQIILNLQVSGTEWAGVWQNGRMHLLSHPPLVTYTHDGQTSTYYPNYHAYGINDLGDIVGDADGNSAAMWRDGQFSYLAGMYQRERTASGLTTMETKANGLNNREQIIGAVSDEFNAKNPEMHACIWQNGEAQDLNALIPRNSGWVLEDARAINDKGRIVGRGKYYGQEHAFLLTPVPN